MAFYSIEIRDNAFYPCIKADSREQAEKIAEEWFYERYPVMNTQEIHPSCDKCYHSVHEDSIDSVSICNCCKNFDCFELDD